MVDLVRGDVYAPLLAELLMPLPGYSLAWWAWTTLSILCWLGSLAMLLWAFRRELWFRVPTAYRPIVLVSLLLFRPVIFHVRFGQVELVLLGLLTAAWLALRTERTRAGGLLLGITIALKLLTAPMCVCVPLLAARQYRTVASTAVACALVGILSFAYVGIDQLQTYVLQVLPELQRDALLDADNRALVMSIQLFVGPEATTWVRVLVPVLVLSTALVAASHARALRGRVFALGVTVVLLVSPVVWLHYFVLAYWPLMQVVADGGWVARSIAGLSYVLLGATGYVLAAPQEAVVLIALKHAMPTVGVLLLFSVQVFQVIRSRQRDASL